MHRRRPAASGDDLLRLFGSQAVLHPVPNIGSACDWSRFPVDPAQLLHNVRKRGDLVAATENTTVIALFGSPSFMIGTTLAEFVGSLDGLFSTWHDRLAAHHPRVVHLIGESTDEQSVEALARYSKRLHLEQLLLHDFATETRSVLSLIHSPNLVTSPTDAAALAVLLRAAGIEQQELDFATKLRELLSDRIEVRRHGAQALDLPYFQPALREGSHRERGMLLVALHVAPTVHAAPGRITAAPVHDFLHAYFTATEGRIPDDEEAAALMRAVTAPDGIAIAALTTDHAHDTATTGSS
jgi:hypothetical protein